MDEESDCRSEEERETGKGVELEVGVGFMALGINFCCCVLGMYLVFSSCRFGRRLDMVVHCEKIGDETCNSDEEAGGRSKRAAANIRFR